MDRVSLLFLSCRVKGELHGAGREVAVLAGRRCGGNSEDPQAPSRAAPPPEPARGEAPAPPRPETGAPGCLRGEPP